MTESDNFIGPASPDRDILDSFFFPHRRQILTVIESGTEIISG